MRKEIIGLSIIVFGMVLAITSITFAIMGVLNSDYQDKETKCYDGYLNEIKNEVCLEKVNINQKSKIFEDYGLLGFFISSLIIVIGFGIKEGKEE